MKVYLVYGESNLESYDDTGAVYHYGIFSTEEEALKIAAKLREGLRASDGTETIFVTPFAMDTPTVWYYDTMETLLSELE